MKNRKITFRVTQEEYDLIDSKSRQKNILYMVAGGICLLTSEILCCHNQEERM